MPSRLGPDPIVAEALANAESAEAAVQWLAVYVANDAARSRYGRPGSALVEAYRRVCALADAEFNAEVGGDA